jgi:hypothetical protein
MSLNHLLDKDNLQTYEDGRVNLTVGEINCQTGTNTTSATNKSYVDNAISTSIGNIDHIYDLNQVIVESNTLLTGGVQNVIFNNPRGFYVTGFIAFLSEPDGTTTPLQLNVERQSTFGGSWVVANNLAPIEFGQNDTTSNIQTGLLQYTNAYRRYRVNITQISATTQAKGLRVVLLGKLL